MMAFDRKPSRPTLEPKTVEALRASFTKAIAQGSHTDAMRPLLSDAAKQAHDKGIEPERLLVLLKEIWYSIPAVAVAAASGKETALLQELVSRCIREYYAF